MNAPTVFQTSTYLGAYARGFGRGKKFHRLSVPGGRIWLQSRGRSARRLECWGAGLHDLGAAWTEDEAAARRLFAAVKELAGRHDGAVLSQISAASPLIELAISAGWKTSPAETCPVLELPATYDAYVRSLGKNMRDQIKRYPKRLEKQFQVEYELARTPAQVDAALADLFRLHGKRWRARGQTGVLGLPSRQRFHRAVCQGLLKRDALRLWTLRCDGAPACVLLNYVHQGVYYFFIGGFEPELMRWSVGTCLFARVFETAISEGATSFDFLKGEEEYKYRYGAQDVAYLNLTWFKPTPRGTLLARRHRLETEFMARLHARFSAAGPSAAKGSPPGDSNAEQPATESVNP